MDNGLHFGIRQGFFDGDHIGLTRGIMAGQFTGSQLNKTIILRESGTWTCPKNVTKIFVECWGGGGGGGGQSISQNRKGCGGGGGAYAASFLSVTPSKKYYFRVGNGGLGGDLSGAGNATNGETTQWEDGTEVRAVGGTRGIGSQASGDANGGNGGAASSCVGTFRFSGGRGGGHNTTVGYGFGGGAGAGRYKDGLNQPVITRVAILPTAWGGRGGDGCNQDAGPASNGDPRGGGGGGAAGLSSLPQTGGAGGRGEIWISYSDEKAQIEKSEIFTSSGSWTCPVGINQVLVECFGGGGGGGSRSSGPQTYACGGGGGAYANKILQVIAGQVYNFTVGAGGAGGAASAANPGAAGGTSQWDDGSQILAVGGTGGASPGTGPAGVGGSSASCVGDVKFSGGNGALGSLLSSGAAGGGGGAGGPNRNGATALTTPAEGPRLGGKGGGGFAGNGANGVANTVAATGSAGGQFGGGGAGASRPASLDVAGGAGATGAVVITYSTNINTIL